MNSGNYSSIYLISMIQVIKNKSF